MTSSKSDVMIIGGGAVGLCSAYYLNKEGLSVTVLDQGEIGHGSSLRNAGYLSPSHFIPLAAPGVFTQGLKWMLNPRSPLYIKPRLDPDFLKWSWNFAKSCNESKVQKAIPVLRDLLNASKDFTQKIASDTGIDFEIQKRGINLLFYSEKGRKKCEHELEIAHKIGMDAEMLNQQELQNRDPDIEFQAEGGLHFPGDMHLSPELFVNNLHRHLKQQGVQFFTHTRVQSFEHNLNGPKQNLSKVITTKGVFEAKNFILAGGAWSAEILKPLKIKMLLQAGKGYSITVENPEIKPNSPYIFLEKRVAITPFSKSLRFAGTMEFSGINHHIREERVEAISDALPFYFRNIPKLQTKKHLVWCGLRPVTPDGMPYLGRLKQIPNLIVATGHAMLGISFSALTGTVVRDLVAEFKSPYDLTLLNPNRFD
ncbi:MAG: FAD-dependent oxidoreductase [Oligoflexales bacterium]|nr:FAD-dependent oxidoreductase [Oligoflexales bacterium]